jgi:hypothetical protein
LCNRWYYQNGIAIEARGIEFLSARHIRIMTRASWRICEWWKKILTNWKTSHHGRCWWGRYLLQIFKTSTR